jgi:preprotein translocase subunit SecE
MKTLNPVSRVLGSLNFLKETRVEAKRVNWPTREKTMKDTLVVIIFAVAVALFLSSFDFLFQRLLKYLFQIF